MALDEKTRERLLKAKIARIYEKRAKVRVKDLRIFVVNIVFLATAALLIPLGFILIGVFLGSPANGKDAVSDITSASFSASASQYGFFVGANVGAILTGIGAFALILSTVGFIDDYSQAKKQVIQDLMRVDQENAASEAGAEKQTIPE
jgi:hypothetical protein